MPAPIRERLLYKRGPVLPCLRSTAMEAAAEGVCDSPAVKIGELPSDVLLTLFLPV